jgi:hypothetical protein
MTTLGAWLRLTRQVRLVSKAATVKGGTDAGIREVN